MQLPLQRQRNLTASLVRYTLVASSRCHQLTKLMHLVNKTVTVNPASLQLGGSCTPVMRFRAWWSTERSRAARNPIQLDEGKGHVKGQGQGQGHGWG